MKFLIRTIFIVYLVILHFFVIQNVHAQEIVQDKETITRAKVIDVIKQEIRNVPGTDTKTNYQTLKVKILEGDEKDKEVTVENDYLNLKKGETFYLMHTIGVFDGRDLYSVFEAYRLPAIYFFVALFVLCVFIFGGIQGIRGLLSLIGSFLFIIYLLLPRILHGYSPILVSIGVSSLIIIIGSYITHGFNKTTTSAVIGMVVTITLTGLLAWSAVYFAHLSGFSSEESVYLNFNTGGTIDFAGLLLGAILIGLLGILYDTAITQAIAVEELNRIAPHLPKSTIYKRAIRMGREHIGALVNTLAIAYVGAALPLLLLFYSYKTDIGQMINREIFATEIIRTMVGSIGLILAVPITTFISVAFLMKKTPINNQSVIKDEEKALNQMGHLH